MALGWHAAELARRREAAQLSPAPLEPAVLPPPCRVRCSGLRAPNLHSALKASPSLPLNVRLAHPQTPILFCVYSVRRPQQWLGRQHDLIPPPSQRASERYGTATPLTLSP